MVPVNGDAKTPLFEGSELAVTFVRTAVGPNTRPGLEIIRLIEKADSQGLALVRERAPFAPMPTDAQIRFADQVVLIRSPFRVSFAYAGAGSGLAAGMARPDAASGHDPHHRARQRDRSGACGLQRRHRSCQRAGRMRACQERHRLSDGAIEAGDADKKEEQL